MWDLRNPTYCCRLSISIGRAEFLPRALEPEHLAALSRVRRLFRSHLFSCPVRDDVSNGACRSFFPLHSPWTGKTRFDILLCMSKMSDITIIDDKNLRGVVAARGRISKDMLEDIVDIIELSSPESIAQDERRIKEADKSDSWIPYAEVKKRAKRAR